MLTDLAPLPTVQRPAAVLEQIRQGAHDTRGTMARETLRAMHRGFEAFSAWCIKAHHVALPANARP